MRGRLYLAEGEQGEQEREVDGQNDRIPYPVNLTFARDNFKENGEEIDRSDAYDRSSCFLFEESSGNVCEAAWPVFYGERVGCYEDVVTSRCNKPHKIRDHGDIDKLERVDGVLDERLAIQLSKDHETEVFHEEDNRPQQGQVKRHKEDISRRKNNLAYEEVYLRRDGSIECVWRHENGI